MYWYTKMPFGEGASIIVRAPLKLKTQANIKHMSTERTTLDRRCIDSGKDIQLTLAVKAKTITSGLKYSLATGNWGQGRAPVSFTPPPQIKSRVDSLCVKLLTAKCLTRRCLNRINHVHAFTSVVRHVIV